MSDVAGFSTQELVGELMARIHPDCIVTAAVIAVEALNGNGRRSCFVLWDNDSTVWNHMGMTAILDEKLRERLAIAQQVCGDEEEDAA